MNTDRNHIDHNLLVLYLLDEISTEGKVLVEKWIEASEANRAIFSGLEKTWNETGKLEPAPVVVDTDRAWEKMKARIQAQEIGPQAETSRTKVRSLRRKTVLYTAAAALLALSAATIFLTDWLRKDSGPVPVFYESIAEALTDTLSDGSGIILNAGSQLRYQEEEQKRERQVELKGEAFFAVKPDSTKPFVIDAGMGSIRVLGTEFNVKAYENSDLEVLVESGLVQLALLDENNEPIETLLLTSGEKGVISHTENRLYKTKNLQPDELFWANRKLIFRETQLAQVLDVLKNYYRFELKTSPEILECLLTASFTNQEIGTILEVIAASFELDLSLEEGHYQLTGKGCSDE